MRLPIPAASTTTFMERCPGDGAVEALLGDDRTHEAKRPGVVQRPAESGIPASGDVRIEAYGGRLNRDVQAPRFASMPDGIIGDEHANDEKF